jgi:hypothetical protein
VLSHSNGRPSAVDKSAVAGPGTGLLRVDQFDPDIDHDPHELTLLRRNPVQEKDRRFWAKVMSKPLPAELSHNWD